jgi:hypothetical protein
LKPTKKMSSEEAVAMFNFCGSLVPLNQLDKLKFVSRGQPKRT